MNYSGRKFEKFGELSFCDFSDLTNWDAARKFMPGKVCVRNSLCFKVETGPGINLFGSGERSIKMPGVLLPGIRHEQLL